MATDVVFAFGPYRLDRILRRGDQTVELTPKAIGVLRTLIARPGDLVTKDELLAAVWPGLVVTDAALTVCVAEIRKALGDDARNARFITTVHRRGYRFVATVRTAGDSDFRSPTTHAAASTPFSFDDDNDTDALVGRAGEKAALRRALDLANRGIRQMIFVSGEPGIGKTAIVEAFQGELRRSGVVWIARGQCIEHHGAAEAYMPLLDSLNRLCQGTRGAELQKLFLQHAPLWLSQMPGLLEEAELESLASRLLQVTRERMLRELTDLVESVADKELFVLCLEDLQWSDSATLDWLAFVARRRDSARLLVIATYRKAAMQGAAPALASLTRELKLHHLCTELTPGPLTVAAVNQYLARRCCHVPCVATRSGTASMMSESGLSLARLIQIRTGGNPLFMTHLLDDLFARGVLHEYPDGQLRTLTEGDLAGLPSGLKQMIAEQFETFSTKERDLLETASVAGASFSAATIAAGLALDVDRAETLCADVARSTKLLCANGLAEWPDGTIASRYEFVHQIYRESAYELTPPGRAVEIHRRIGAREWRAYGPRALEIAAALALHHERGHEYLAASKFCLLAAENATQRGAYAEAVTQLHHGITLIESAPASDVSARLAQELALRLAVGPTLISMCGSATEDVAVCYERAAEIARQLEKPADEFVASFGLRASTLARGELQRADSLGGELLSLAGALADTGFTLEAHLALANTSFQMGALVAARMHLDAALMHYDPDAHYAHAAIYGLEPGMFCLSLMALVLELCGEPDTAQQMSDRALALGRALHHPYSAATAANFAAWFHHLREEPEETQAYATEAIEIATRHGFTSAIALGLMRRGWSFSAQGQPDKGILELQTGLASWQQIGSALGRPHFLGLMADAHRIGGHPLEGLVAVTAALRESERTGERWTTSELYRLRGELTLAATQDAKRASREFLRAAEIASAQCSRLFENRALIALASVGST